MNDPSHGSDPLAGLDPADLLKQGVAEDTLTGGARTSFVPPTVGELATVFPQFEVLELIGKGGMGAVYKVRQKELERVVALKILPPAIAEERSFPERFAREAKALAKLNHPGIVTIHEFGQAGEFYFILMEHVDGVNLRQLLAGGRISPREALAIVPQICDALQFAHDRGIVHRDIKPENILLDRLGRVKVADFGIAKLAGGQEAGASGHHAGGEMVTEAGKVIGTPDYMAPEQVERPDEVDHRADIYALGVVFYQMLTGELPAGDMSAPSRKVRVDVRLDEVVLRALERDPEMRYQQASAMKTRVEEVEEQPGAAPPVRRWRNDLDFKSRARLFGLPLLHVTSGQDPETGRPRVAKGIVAIGDRARGVVAVGGIASGGLAIGGLAMGVFAFGGLTAGLVSFGGLALALVLAVGGLSVAPVAMGGSTVGYFSFGGKAYGMHALGSNVRDPEAMNFFEPWAMQVMSNLGTASVILVFLTLILGLGVPMWLLWRAGPVERKASRPWGIGKAILVVLAAIVGMIGVLIVAIALYWTVGRRDTVDMTRTGNSAVPEAASAGAGATDEVVRKNGESITINILGEVGRQGQQPLPAGASLLDAMAAAGGWTEQADLRRISIMEKESGDPEFHDLRAILEGRAANPEITDQTVIIVAEKQF